MKWTVLEKRWPMAKVEGPYQLNITIPKANGPKTDSDKFKRKELSRPSTFSPFGPSIFQDF